MLAEPRALITGATGFVGTRVLKAWPQAVAWPKVDLRQRQAVEDNIKRLLRESPFDSVLHLAAKSSIQSSFGDPVPMFEVNLMGTVHLLEALSRAEWRGRFLLVSSGAVYGDLAKVVFPLDESSPVRPNSPYAASKAGAEQAVLEWGRRRQSDVMVARPSNHAGPGQIDHYFLSSMAKQIAAVPRLSSISVETGNLEVYRDFLHVDDVIEAYGAILGRGRPDTIYNVASGQPQKLSSLLERLATVSGRTVSIRVSDQRFRAEVARPLEISTQRLYRDTGWTPSRGVDQLCTDLISFWEGVP